MSDLIEHGLSVLGSTILQGVPVRDD